jgi:hypothetical protein
MTARVYASSQSCRLRSSLSRSAELLDLTMADTRWRGRLKEIARARELLCDAASGGHEYGTTPGRSTATSSPSR